MARKIADREAQIAKIGEESLRERLILAERLCVLFGWNAARNETAMDRLEANAWNDWRRHMGSDATSPQANAALNRLSLPARGFRAPSSPNSGEGE